MDLPHRADVVVVGAGHNGLAMSRLLTLAGRDHVVAERRATLGGGGWQDRWDGFRLVSPNWTSGSPASRSKATNRTRSCPATRSPPRSGATRKP